MSQPQNKLDEILDAVKTMRLDFSRLEERVIKHFGAENVNVYMDEIQINTSMDPKAFAAAVRDARCPYKLSDQAASENFGGYSEQRLAALETNAVSGIGTLFTQTGRYNKDAPTVDIYKATAERMLGQAQPFTLDKSWIENRGMMPTHPGTCVYWKNRGGHESTIRTHAGSLDWSLDVNAECEADKLGDEEITHWRRA